MRKTASNRYTTRDH